MDGHRQPAVIQSVEIASRKAAVAMRQHLARGKGSLAFIASGASMVGLLGTTIQILTHTFYSCGGNWGSCTAPVGGRLADALALSAAGLFVAMVAFCSHRYLCAQMETFDREMENAWSDLVNRLVVHLGRLRAEGIYVLPTVNGCSYPPLVFTPSAGAAIDEQATAKLSAELRFYAIQTKQHGLWQLIWPQFDSEIEVDSALQAGMCLTLIYAVLAWTAFALQGKPNSGVAMAIFFTVAAFGLRSGSFFALCSLFAFFSLACSACVVPYGWSVGAAALAIAPVPIIGVAKASLRQRKLKLAAVGVWTMLRPWSTISLAVAGLSAAIAILFATVLALHQVHSRSMEPTFYAGDWVVSLNAPLLPKVHRGHLVTFSVWDSFALARVAGVPGDSIRLEAGRLMVNGKLVAEPNRESSLVPGLPPWPGATPSELLRYDYESTYGNSLDHQTSFVVPEDEYVLLNDNRAELRDSRTSRILPTSSVTGRPLYVWRPRNGLWSLPHLVY